MSTTIIDVSKHNGAIDWNKVKASGIGGAILRCGYGSDIKSQDDERFKEYADACTKLGIPFGVYLYSYAKNTTMAKSEAAHALRVVKGYKLSLPLYFDSEEPGTGNAAKENAIAFCKEIEAAGYMPGIYASESWWKNYLPGVEEYTKWVAKYNNNDGKPGKKPSIKNMDIWQYTSKGSCAGINSAGLDMNICYRDFTSETGQAKVPQNAAKKSNEEIAEEVIAGKWGTQPQRQKDLEAAGYNYEAIRTIVNAKAGASTVPYYKKYTGTSVSIVDALTAIGVDSSKSNRKKIAKANGIAAYSGMAAENKKMLKLLKEGKLVKA